MTDRTQHALKNRFYTLISCFSNTPIRKIKKEKRYLKSAVIAEALIEHEALLKNRPVEIKKEA